MTCAQAVEAMKKVADVAKGPPTVQIATTAPSEPEPVSGVIE
jgi:hypothetical protein